MPFPAAAAPDSGVTLEHFTLSGDRVQRSIRLRTGETITTTESVRPSDFPMRHTDLAALFYDAWLRRKSPGEVAGDPLTVADLFSGCGGLSVGAHEAARATGRRALHVLAVDSNSDALNVFGDNFPEAELYSGGIEELVDGELGASLTRRERRLRANLDGLELAIGGPPCQGHSDLNNHTRRQDPRNALYLRMVRFVEVTHPRFVVIENVPGVAHDKTGVVRTALQALREAGYAVAEGVVAATDFGAAQSRRRHVVVASREAPSIAPVSTLAQEFGAPAGTVLDAIGDLGLEPHLGAFGTSARHAAVNRERIDYLFDHDLWDLPNSKRPDCHRLKRHSYVSVYGRMYEDRPAPTITSGFGSTGQGRFVHPRERRTLTPHEAARLQGFPDWFTFRAIEGRRALQQMIGNAVPSRLAYAVIASMLR